MKLYLKIIRSIELQEKQKIYQWRQKGQDPGMEALPGYIAAGSDMNALPRDARFDVDRILEAFSIYSLGTLNNGKDIPI